MTSGVQANLIPGAGALGFGIDVATAQDWTQQTSRVVELDEQDGTTIFEPPNGANRTEYLLPDNVSHIDLWANESSYELFDSRKSYSEQMAAKAEIEASAWGFSGQFSASYSSISEGQSDTFYGLASFHAQMWELVIDDLSSLSLDPTFASELGDLPAKFEASSREEFFLFLAKWGTHVVTSVIVGGNLDYSVTCSSQSGFSEEKAKASMQYEYESVFVDSSGSASADWQKMGSEWVASRKAHLRATGGTPDLFDGFAPPANFSEPVNFNDVVKKWTDSVAATPGILSARLRPIWSVATPERATVLKEALYAYLNASVVSSASLEEDMKTGRVAVASAAATVGAADLQPPSASSQLFQLWIVLAAGDGEVKFTQAAPEDDPGAFDALVSAAEAAAENQSYWVLVMASGVTAPPGPRVLRWLASCGISLSPSWGKLYPGRPQVLSAIGQTHSSQFNAAVAESDRPQGLTVRTVELPLCVGSDLPGG